MESYDVVIIGGGISGLYSAWRLGKETNLKILLLESTDRYGGRFHTVTMPGGYRADLGAMRFVPELHKVLKYITDEFAVDTVAMAATDEPGNTLPTRYFRGQRPNDFQQFCDILGLSEDDKKLMLQVYTMLDPKFVADEIEVPDDGNYAEAIVKRTGQKAVDMSVSQFLALSGNPELVRLSDMKYPPGNWPLADSLLKMSKIAEFFKPGSVFRIIGGYENLVSALVKAIRKFSSVDMRLNHKVVQIDEQSPHQFTIDASCDKQSNKFQCGKIIFACSSVGLRRIQFVSQSYRQQRIQQLLDQTRMLSSFKVFLTYKTAWWEKFGFHFGGMTTDLPISLCMALGAAGKVGGYATLLATYTLRDIEVFESLDRPHYQRYETSLGNIAEDLIPSTRLVEYCEQQVCKLLGCDSPPERPVSAVKKFWGADGTQGISTYCKAGVNSNKLHWESLKPFSDSEVYIASDCFTASEPSMCHVGFAETSLLTTERIMVNFFGLNPVRDDLCLSDPWP